MGRTTTDVMEDHLARRLAGDIEEDIKENFAQDVVILSSFGTYEGHDGVRQSAARLAEVVGEGEYQYDHTIIQKDYAFLEWTAKAKDKEICDGVDSFAIKDGKIVMQTIHYSARPK